MKCFMCGWTGHPDDLIAITDEAESINDFVHCPECRGLQWTENDKLKWFQCFDCTLIEGEFQAFQNEADECPVCGKEAKELSEDSVIYRANKTGLYNKLAKTLIVRKWADKAFSVHEQVTNENGVVLCEANLYTCQHWQLAVRYLYEGTHNLPNSIRIPA